jgi:hypothetical protein
LLQSIEICEREVKWSDRKWVLPCVLCIVTDDALHMLIFSGGWWAQELVKQLWKCELAFWRGGAKFYVTSFYSYFLALIS